MWALCNSVNGVYQYVCLRTAVHASHNQIVHDTFICRLSLRPVQRKRLLLLIREGLFLSRTVYLCLTFHSCLITAHHYVRPTWPDRLRSAFSSRHTQVFAAKWGLQFGVTKVWWHSQRANGVMRDRSDSSLTRSTPETLNRTVTMATWWRIRCFLQDVQLHFSEHKSTTGYLMISSVTRRV